MQFIDLAAQQARLKDKIDARIQAVLSHGKYILGPEVAELEQKLAEFCGAKHCIACANGTDALLLALMALNVRTGDAVICPSFTFAATAEVVPSLGATPIFADIDPDTYTLDPASLQRCIALARDLGLTPRVVIPVDLFGLAADHDAIAAIAAEHDMTVIDDAAQGFGAGYHGKRAGGIGPLATTSFFPAKPLGCYGDGGAVFTDDTATAELLSSYRFHGKGTQKYDNVRIGMNSRLDTLQAAILLEKLAVYSDELEARDRVAQRYTDTISQAFKTPTVPQGYTSVWAQYTLLAQSEDHRSRAIEGLKSQGIPTAIYYPLPLHQQTAYAKFPQDPNGLAVSEACAQTAFSLPMHPYLSTDEQDRVIAALAQV
ncbi:DegT/DnrJ/EryC1/StrS family aminotransferase [Algirhabdus cladophorae]|uniref:DegT/DnrJ/EryC1/StrS family aminotransferase n=1 Tax=Algirhabdus cladophorae TaxID=3377108 RepID=UPI003B8485EB